MFQCLDIAILYLRDCLTYLEQHCVSPEQLQLFHRLGVESDHRVVIIHCLVHNQPVWALLTLQNGCGIVLVLLAATMQVERCMVSLCTYS